MFHMVTVVWGENNKKENNRYLNSQILDGA